MMLLSIALQQRGLLRNLPKARMITSAAALIMCCTFAGKIRSARISMVCLHRYCAKCIEQYLRAKVPGR
jgi:hypothetical protein